MTDVIYYATVRGKPIHWTLYGLCGYAGALGVQFLLMPPDWGCAETMVPYFATPLLMLFFGPYLLVPSEAWIGPSGCWWWILRMLPLYLAHLAFCWGLLTRLGLVKVSWGERKLQLAELAMVAIWSALGIWYAVPVVERRAFKFEDAKLPGETVRIAVISDLHSCRYGEGQRGLVEMVESQHPDAVVFVGDIFDDRLPDERSQAFIASMVKKRPCIYVSGNHEFWSGRITGMKDWLRETGVTILEGECKTLSIRGNEVCFCGVDDPTFIFDIWYKQLARADESSQGAPLRILLSHRPERPDDYAKYDFDLVVTGHAHGGQWRLPSVNRGTYSPDQHFFPKYADGVYTLSNGKPMLVGRGLARESSPVPRFFNHPHVLIVDLIS